VGILVLQVEVVVITFIQEEVAIIIMITTTKEVGGKMVDSIKNHMKVEEVMEEVKEEDIEEAPEEAIIRTQTIIIARALIKAIAKIRATTHILTPSTKTQIPCSQTTSWRL